MSKMRVAVIFGGVSSEHDISLMSASFIVRNIPAEQYEVVCVGITKKGRWLYYPGSADGILDGSWETHPDCVSAILSPDPVHKGFAKLFEDGTMSFQRVDVIFPVLHGKNGEDGTIQGLFTLAGLPYVGCDTLSSAICMDKAMTHTVLDYNGIRTAKWRAFTRAQLSKLDEICEALEGDFSYPVFVKPANGGSSIGVSRAGNRTELKDAVKLAFSHDNKAVIEETLHGFEVECAVLGNDETFASVVGGIVPPDGVYDFDSKYVLNTTELQIPAKLPADIAETVRETARRAYLALGCTGLARVDFFVTGDGVVLNEVNTLPGFTGISMYPKLMNASGTESSVLLDTLIKLAIDRAEGSHG